MGNFYTNLVLIGSDSAKVLEAMDDMGRNAYVIGDSRRHSVVFDERCDEQDTDEIERLGAALSDRFHVPVIGSMNHDDDLLFFWLFHSGRVVRYETRRDAISFAWELSRIRGGIVIFPFLVIALSWPMIFQVFRHQLVVRLLRLPDFTVGLGHHYITEGDLPDGLSDDDFKRS